MRIYDHHLILSVAVALLAMSCGPRERADEETAAGRDTAPATIPPDTAAAAPGQGIAPVRRDTIPAGQPSGAPTDTALRAKPGTQTGPPAGEQPNQPVKPEPGTRADTAGYRGVERPADTGQAAGADTTAGGSR
jgi:hypothetical protein